MQLGKLAGIVPTRRACFDLLVLVENEYNCCIKFWLDANNPGGGEVGWTVYACGSGDVFDASDGGVAIGRARVLDAEEGNLYRAVWAALLTLESKLSKATMSVTIPPTR